MTEVINIDRATEIDRSLITKFRKPIWNKFIAALKEYELISEGDRVGVCISGGKDSMLLAALIKHLSLYSSVPFEAKFIVMDPGYTPQNRERIEHNAAELGLDVDIFRSSIFSIVENAGGSPCYLCARMRRGFLYERAHSLGCNKIALGHHFDDVIETTLMSMIYGSQVRTMMPKLHSTNFEGMELIRPLYMIRERDIIAWARYNGLEFLNCACRFTERTEGEDPQEQSKRLEMKQLIERLERENKNVPMNIFMSMHNVNLSSVIGYKMGDGDDIHSFLDGYGEKKSKNGNFF